MDDCINYRRNFIGIYYRTINDNPEWVQTHD